MRVLHAGCGGASLPDGAFPGAQEVRLDIDVTHKPDIVASLTEMGDIGGFDGVYSSHCLEHLYPHEVPVALAEFFRVLKPGGLALVVVPDLEDLQVSSRELYKTEAGLSVTAFDLFYGHRRLVAENHYMAHHSGFTERLLREAMTDAKFGPVIVRRESDFSLWAVGIKGST